MQLTKRFFMLNVLAMIVAIALTVLAGMIFIAAYSRFGGAQADMDGFSKSLQVKSGLEELKQATETLEFEQLLDTTYQQRLTKQVDALGAHAVILKNREILYSTNKFTALDMEKSLMLSDQARELGTLELSGKTYQFARVDYRLHTGEEGTLLLLAPVRWKPGFYTIFGIFIVSFFIVAFLLANFVVTYRFSRGIIAPVSRLKDAASKISEGDLSGGIAEEGEGEVKELARTLELMRIKLKESLYLQQKYDENRAFLISSISHDLKTPVTSIKGYIEGILDGVAQTPDKMEQYLTTARSKAMLVNTMIDDLLLYSKLDLNQVPYHFEQTDLVEYVTDAIADYRYEFDRANIALTLVNELQRSVIVSIDRERLARVLQNILDNAKKFMAKGAGQVDIILRETRTSAIIEIRDNGKGIPEQDLPHIFERFYRADASRKSAEGSGLGLAIAKQIVEGQEGKIWVTSTLGVGTRMMISLKKVS